jgi:hypothetical protein
MQYLDQVPDSIKVVAASAAPALTLMGFTLEEWTFILSGIVSVLFIIEKLPKVLSVIRQFWKWLKYG